MRFSILMVESTKKGSSDMWRHVDGWIDANILEEPAASTFRVEECLPWRVRQQFSLNSCYLSTTVHVVILYGHAVPVVTALRGWIFIKSGKVCGWYCGHSCLCRFRPDGSGAGWGYSAHRKAGQPTEHPVCAAGSACTVWYVTVLDFGNPLWGNVTGSAVCTWHWCAFLFWGIGLSLVIHRLYTFSIIKQHLSVIYMQSNKIYKVF